MAAARHGDTSTTSRGSRVSAGKLKHSFGMATSSNQEGIGGIWPGSKGFSLSAVGFAVTCSGRSRTRGRRGEVSGNGRRGAETSPAARGSGAASSGTCNSSNF